MSCNEKLVNKEIIEKCLKDIGTYLKRKSKSKWNVELILVGGASILLNYNFRLTTTDIDCIDTSDLLMNELINKIKEKYDLEIDWINTDFLKSDSYSDKLIEVSKFYKTYGNGILTIRTIKDEYLLAMKIVSGRRYKHDYTDIYGIISDMKNRKIDINMKMINDALIYLYGDLSKANKEAYEFVEDVLNNKIKKDIDDISNIEANNKKKLDEMHKNKKVNKDLLEKIK